MLGAGTFVKLTEFLRSARLVIAAVLVATLTARIGLKFARWLPAHFQGILLQAQDNLRLL